MPEDFNKELVTLLEKYPDVEDVTYSIKAKVKVNRPSKVPNLAEQSRPRDEGAALDLQARAKLASIKALSKLE